jgi:hypothetical protein
MSEEHAVYNRLYLGETKQLNLGADKQVAPLLLSSKFGTRDDLCLMKVCTGEGVKVFGPWLRKLFD